MDGPPPVAAPTGRSRRNWLLPLGVLAAGIYGAIALGGGGRAPDDGRAAAIVPGPAELAGALGSTAADYRRISPVVEPSAAENAASVATGGRFPRPASRRIASYRHATTGAEITMAALVYDDPEEAQRAVDTALPLLASTFGLTSEPLEVPGADDARRLTRTGYDAVAMRIGGRIVLAVTSDAAGPDAALRLAEAMRDRMPAEAATATGG